MKIFSTRSKPVKIMFHNKKNFWYKRKITCIGGNEKPTKNAANQLTPTATELALPLAPCSKHSLT